MARSRLLDARYFAAIAIIALAFALTGHIPANADGQCSDVLTQISGCPTVGGGISNGGVELGGSITTPGSPGAGTGAGGSAPVELPCPMIGVKCLGPRNGHGTVNPAGPVAPITLRDLINFRPAAGVDRMEPNGWMIVGLDTNFYATVEAQVQNGQLLGQPASVKFTPIRYHWTYGDGASASRAVKGGTWASLGIQEFDATPTSHVYSVAGTYDIDLVIEFSAEYRFAARPWTVIPGTIAVPANRLVATAGYATTVLVERDCGRSPSGPGC